MLYLHILLYLIYILFRLILSNIIFFFLDRKQVIM